MQWLSTADAGEQFLPLFEEILGSSDWPCIDRSFFDADRLSQRRVQREVLFAAGSGRRRRDSASDRGAVGRGSAARRRASSAAMAGPGENLCVAGGLVLNALLVSSLERVAGKVFVQPAAGNAGTALGAVFYVWHNVFGQTKRASLNDLCLGPELRRRRNQAGAGKLQAALPLPADRPTSCCDAPCAIWTSEKIIAWMQGRMEFGPRALGNRSILASPLNPYSTENLNIFIKHREPFRKFAASVPAELASEYFEAGPNARYLATVGRVRAPASQDVRGGDSGRRLPCAFTRSAQKDNPLYHRLLHDAGKATGLPVLYNTSFNLFGDPLVCTPRDAVRSFLAVCFG